MMPASRTLSLVLLAASALAGAAAAQVVERNLPPPAVAPSAPKVEAPPLQSDQDDRVIGPALTAIVVLGPTDPVRTGTSVGVNVSAVARLSAAGGDLALRPFLGRPLSRKLISEAAAAVTRLYRRRGFPLVSVTTPAQEVTSGVLQLRVIEFKAGQVKATGGRRTPSGYVEGRVRVKPEGAIDAGALSEDLDWLNRNPFRQVQAVFAPGQGLGLTDLNLPITEARPFRLYGGYAQSGSSATGRDRYILGGQVAGLPGLPDALSSYQFTGSRDAFEMSHPQYVSNAVRLSVPFLPRQQLEAAFDLVESNQPVQDFFSRQVTGELSLGYRFALSDVVPTGVLRVRGDGVLGVEVRQADRQLLFGGETVQHTTIDVLQVYVGYTAAFRDRFGVTNLNAVAHISPGGVDRRNGDAAYLAFSNGRTTSASYAYLNLQASRYTPLPHGFALATDVIAQYAGAALPDTEQTAIGAPSLVRGYSLDDGAFDSGIVVRDELRAPAVRLIPARFGMSDGLQPHVFVDAGYGFERVVHREQTAVSAGVGADYRLGAHLQLSGDAACALRDAPYTRAGDCRVEGRLNLTY